MHGHVATRSEDKNVSMRGDMPHAEQSEFKDIFAENGTTHAQTDEMLPFSSSSLAQTRRRAVVSTEVVVRLVLAQTCTNIGSFI